MKGTQKMIFDPTNLKRTIDRYHRAPLPYGAIPWGKIRTRKPPAVGLLVESTSGLFYMYNNEYCRLLDQVAVRRAIHTVISE